MPATDDVTTLQLSRRDGESITIVLPDGRRVTVIQAGRAMSSAERNIVVRAPRDVEVLRSELLDRPRPTCPRNVHKLREVGDGSFRCVACERLFDKRDGMLVERWCAMAAPATPELAEVAK